MSYRKLKGDHLFDGHCFLPSNKVLITDSEGKIMDITNFADAGDEVENYKGIFRPGSLMHIVILSFRILKVLFLKKRD